MEDYWPSNLANLASFGFTMRPFLKKKKKISWGLERGLRSVYCSPRIRIWFLRTHMDSQQPVTSLPGHVMLSYIFYGLLYICSMHKFTHYHTLHSYTHRHAHAHIHKKSNTFTTLHSYKQNFRVPLYLGCSFRLWGWHSRNRFNVCHLKALVLDILR